MYNIHNYTYYVYNTYIYDYVARKNMLFHSSLCSSNNTFVDCLLFVRLHSISMSQT